MCDWSKSVDWFLNTKLLKNVREKVLISLKNVIAPNYNEICICCGGLCYVLGKVNGFVSVNRKGKSCWQQSFGGKGLHICLCKVMAKFSFSL